MVLQIMKRSKYKEILQKVGYKPILKQVELI